MVITMEKRKIDTRRPEDRRKKKKIPNTACSTSTPPWIELPDDVTENILQRLGAIDILENAQNVCTTWRRVCKDPSMWQVIDMRRRPPTFRVIANLHYFGRRYDSNATCLHAVDRSQGQLTDLYLECSATDELLSYVSRKCRRLKRLTLVHCSDITLKGLRAAAKNLAELEELNLLHLPVQAKDIESIGNCCRRLKSFTLIRNCAPPRDIILIMPRDKYAFAIAKSMPNLQHLSLFGDLELGNEDLEAILDGCRNLESLDIRRCWCLDLTEDLGRRCSRQIKHVKLPSDWNRNYKWYSEYVYKYVIECQNGR